MERSARLRLWTIASLGLGFWMLSFSSAFGEETAPDTRLLWGFEKTEFQKPDVVVEKDPNTAVVNLGGREGPRQITIKKGDASQGEWAAAYVIAEREWGHALGGYKPGNYKPIFNHRGIVYHDLFNTSASHSGGSTPFPGGRDWSGWARLYLDAKSSSDAVFRLGIEDTDVSPAVERKFKIPAGKWVTVEMDLEKAVSVRGLNPAQVVSLWIFLEEMSAPGTILFDNLRLAKAGKKPDLPVATDDSSYEIRKREYAVIPFVDLKTTAGGQWQMADFPKDKPAPTPRDMQLPKDLGPWQIAFDEMPPIGGMNRKGGGFVFRQGATTLCPAAFDAKRIAVPVCVPEGNYWNGTVMIVSTVDGGKTWTGVGGTGPASPLTYMTDGCGGETSADSAETYVLSNFGCTMDGWPQDRLFFAKARLTENGWTTTPATPVERDMRHCTTSPAAIGLSSGRIWAAWANWGRFAVGELWAKYSDDGGRTWNSWRPGKRSMLPGGDRVCGDAYSYMALFLVPYGDNQVACVGNCQMWTFDGVKWNGPIRFMDPSRSPDSVMPLGGTQMLWVNRSGIHRFDGTNNVQETIEGLDPDAGKRPAVGRFCKSGEQILFFAGTDFPTKDNYPSSFRKLQCWRRNAEGVWKGPETVADEKEPIVTYTTTRFTDLPFVVVAWRAGDLRQFKIQLVPVERAGQKGI